MKKREHNKLILGTGSGEISIPKTPMRFLFHISKPHKWWAFSAILAATLAQFVSSSIPLIFREVIDIANEAAEGLRSVDDIWFWVVVYPSAVATMFFFWRLSGFLGMQWNTRLNATAYETLFQYLSEHSHTYFSNRFAGSLSSKVSHASEGSQSMGEAMLWNYYTTALSLVITTIYIFTSSSVAGFVFLSLILLLIPINVMLSRYRRPHVVKYSEQATRARGYAVDSITNIAAVRQFSRYREERIQFSNEINFMRELNLKHWRISEWALILNNVIIVLFELLVLAIAVRAWVMGTISVGELVMIITLMLSVQNSLVFIGNSMNGFIRRYGEIQEGLEEVLLPHEIIDAPDAKKLTIKDAKVHFEALNFAYDTGYVFKNLNLTIESGQRVGLVGPSGAGKTTLVSLLLRQHEVTDGAILIDGQNVAEVTQDSLRGAIAVVPQEPLLFHRTIKENIAYGKPRATQKEIERVARMAEAHDFISALPEEYDTLVGERGIKLSGGQKQRIAIARAMLKDAPILVLDEATSALDSESEVAIQKALHELMEGKTVLAIAHRLSTLREMDRIIVLENGAIVEDGTHEMLARAGGTYQRLWEHQAGGFLQE